MKKYVLMAFLIFGSSCQPNYFQLPDSSSSPAPAPEGGNQLPVPTPIPTVSEENSVPVPVVNDKSKIFIDQDKVDAADAKARVFPIEGEKVDTSKFPEGSCYKTANGDEICAVPDDGCGAGGCEPVKQ